MRKISLFMSISCLIVMLTVTAAAEPVLSGAVITQMPTTITVGGRTLCPGMALTAAQLDAALGAGDFSYIPVYEDGSLGDAVTVSVCRIELPRVENFSVTTCKNATVSGRFRGNCGEEAEYYVTNSPKKGKVTISGNTFVYEPYQNRKGLDSFTYTVRGADGTVSEEATVTVNIERRRPEVEYVDTDGTAYEYAALRLAEEGIYTGSCIAGKYVFNGEDYVNLDEYEAMASLAGGTAECLASDGEPLTRAEAALRLVEILNENSRTGLFSWTAES